MAGMWWDGGATSSGVGKHFDWWDTLDLNLDNGAEAVADGLFRWPTL